MSFLLTILALILKKGKISEKDYSFKSEKYVGIDNNLVPMRIYYSKKYSKKTIIMFLGASPDGEQHKALNYLAKTLTKFGYNVFIPRIPPLMQLDISNKNVDWITYLYELIDDLIGWDSAGMSWQADADPYPKEGVASSSTWAHGTHVAGILAATTNNGIGMASSMFNGKIVSVKCSRDGSDEDEPPINDGYNGITYAAKAGYYAGMRTIINNSWGGGGWTSSENAAINNAQDTYGAIILGAAGNGDENGGGGQEYGAHYPSSYDNCISVCAIGCSYSWGNWATYHHSIDIASPGENIRSTTCNGYASWDGSSMASPIAASVQMVVAIPAVARVVAICRPSMRGRPSAQIARIVVRSESASKQTRTESLADTVANTSGTARSVSNFEDITSSLNTRERDCGARSALP